MKKAMIEAAVTRGIREMEEDPERSIRRLADLGRQFSKTVSRIRFFQSSKNCSTTKTAPTTI